MRHSLLILVTASTLAGCGHVAGREDAQRGLDPVNVPVVSRQDLAFDAITPNGSLGSIEAARLDGWFRGMDLGYGDSIYVTGPYATSARAEVAAVAGRYGLLVTEGGPVLPGTITPGATRIVVSRTRASVPNCPNWSEASSPNYNNHSMSNFGCAVNGNLAAMIGNPEDLVYGRDGAGVSDSMASTKAIESYRAMKPTGEGGLKDISTKGK